MSDVKITVKAVESEEQKSVQETQAELDAKREQEAAQNNTEEEDAPEVPEVTPEQVLSFFEKTRGKKLNSLDEIPFEPIERVVEKEIELDEDVAAYQKFRKETGRGIADFYKLNTLSDSISDEDALFLSYQSQHKFLTPDEIKQKIQDDFGYDPDDDTDIYKRQKEYAKKEAVAKAREALSAERQKYSTPLESKGLDLPEEEKTAYQNFKQSKESSENEARLAQEKRQYFTERTNELFSDKFEGFKFKIGEDKDIVFKVENVDSIKENQLNIDNFIGKFIDENKNLKNVEEYHRAIAIGSDPDKFAKFFYDQGMSDSIKNMEVESKNLDMNRNTQQSMTIKGGITVKSVDDNTTKLVIKK